MIFECIQGGRIETLEGPARTAEVNFGDRFVSSSENKQRYIGRLDLSDKTAKFVQVPPFEDKPAKFAQTPPFEDKPWNSAERPKFEPSCFQCGLLKGNVEGSKEEEEDYMQFWARWKVIG